MKDLQVKLKELPFGIMVWWDKSEEATGYQVKLYLEGQKDTNNALELTTVSIERNTFYHSFTGLADNFYLIEVIAENREGESIAYGAAKQEVRPLIYHIDPEWNIKHWGY